MRIRDAIETKIRDAFAPVALAIEDDSHRHAGHAGAREGGDSHFTVTIVAAAFEGQSRIERQRAVNALLAEEFARGLHALSLTTLTPAEAARRR